MPVVEANSLLCLVGAARTDKDTTQADRVTLPLRAPGGPGHDSHCPAPPHYPSPAQAPASASYALNTPLVLPFLGPPLDRITCPSRAGS